MLQNLSSAAVVIGALRVNSDMSSVGVVRCNADLVFQKVIDFMIFDAIKEMTPM